MCAAGLPPSDDIVAVVYDELKRLANVILRGERVGHTLQPTALVNEAYLRLAQQDRVLFQDRGHVVALAASAMRRILVDHARQRLAQKRGGGANRVTLDESLSQASGGDAAEVDLLALEEALERLGEMNSRHARIAELRVFGGLEILEIAGELGVSRSTVAAEWRVGRAWLGSQLSVEDD